MNNKEKELNDIANEIRREKAKIWRANNKEKVKEINKRYWLKKAKQVGLTYIQIYYLKK